MPLFDSRPAAPDMQRRSGVHPVLTVAVTGGKGGVGKTSVSVNLATVCAAAGKRVLLLDGDLGLANVDVFLGLSPRYNLTHVLTGEHTLEEIIVDAPQGFQIVPAASGGAEMMNLGVAEHIGLVRAFSTLSSNLDMMIVDTAAGLSQSVLQFSQAAQHVLVVICDEPASIADAHALIKVLSRNHGVQRFRVLANMSRTKGGGNALFAKFASIAARLLDVTLEYAGEIPDDSYMRQATREQRPVAQAYPASPSSRAFRELASKVDVWPIPAGPRGNLEFFVERLVQRPAVQLEVIQ